MQEAMTELLAEFGCDAAEGKVMDAAELREQADTVAEQQAEVLKEKLVAERPAPEETLSFYVAECLEFTFAGEFHDHLTMEEALEAYDKIPSENYNMIDGCVNNVPKKPRRIGGRWSVLDRLHIKQAERRQKDNAPQQEQERSRKS